MRGQHFHSFAERAFTLLLSAPVARLLPSPLYRNRLAKGRHRREPSPPPVSPRRCRSSAANAPLTALSPKPGHCRALINGCSPASQARRKLAEGERFDDGPPASEKTPAAELGMARGKILTQCQRAATWPADAPFSIRATSTTHRRGDFDVGRPRAF